ncbi:hypothetical protein A2W14_02795 [Candidatus Gottesmanbacteria bacterium RBG_16_37_8]|uniref:Glycosyltransferase RgtA/B/C/D-like domain-containing protein n=1 Tax=Candidatus Gottesmanbacteria bacterium RBG_16_37_8 TaxID=1798371 RepID=A0A1F5YSV1_9BACT|nr:MAG: hypothetical protein A2W14_02795 [Candidatus Gottesmanbacteria bacterium RBG_16_37_8]
MKIRKLIEITINQKRLNVVFFLISTFSVLSLNIYPLYVLNSKNYPGRTYALIHNNVQDFYFYQAIMNEGANGANLIYDPYTTEPHRSSIIFSYFTWLGKFSRLTNIPYVYTYHAVRILGSLLFFVSAYFLIHKLRLPHPNLAFLFFLYAAPLFTLRNLGDKIDKIPFMYWWTAMDPVRRSAYLPHHMIGGFLLILSVILILRFFSSGKLKFIIITIFLSPLLAFIHTPSLFILLIVLPSAIIIYLISQFLQNNVKFLWNLRFILLLTFVYWIISLLFLTFMVSQTNKGFPWNQYLVWERNLQYPLNKELIGAFGILFPFALIGILSSLISSKFNRIFVAVWFSVPLLLIPLAPKLSISNIRLIQGLPYFTLAVLAALGLDFLFSLGKVIVNKFFKIPKTLVAFQRLPIKLISLLFYSLIGLLFLIHVFPSIVWSIKDQIREYSPIFGNTYLDNRLHQAFNFINKNYPNKTPILSTFYTGNYLPVYAHTISFIGHSGYTNNLSQKEPLVFKFYENKMTDNEAKSFLMDNKITLVFQGPEEKPIYPQYLYPNILKPVYDKEEATIYVLK